MMLYLILIPGIVVQFFLAFYLNKIRREDETVRSFCIAREHVIDFLASEKGQNLTRQQYSFARWMIEMNSITIAQFFKIKHRLNITTALSSLPYIDRDVVIPAREYQRTDNSDLQKLYHEFIGAMIKNFFAYTPFLDTKITFNLLLGIARLLAKSGITYIKLRALEYTERWESIHRSELNYC